MSACGVRTTVADCADHLLDLVPRDRASVLMKNAGNAAHEVSFEDLETQSFAL